MARNFRDAGEWVNLIAGRELLPAGRLLRGGKLEPGESLAAVGQPRTVINLLFNPDPGLPDEVVVHHFPTDNTYEVYVTADPRIRRWLRDLVRVVAVGVELPVYVHCRSGKDRTGVVVAALLRIAGVPDEVIIEEFLLSEEDDEAGADGATRARRRAVRRERIVTALQGMEPLDRYFHGCDLDAVRRVLLGR